MAPRILVIEDEERIRQFLKRGLTYENYTVDTAVDGKDGLEQARDNPPDLVLLDLMLPGIDGLEVCRRLRAASDVPILMLTAKESIEALQRSSGRSSASACTVRCSLRSRSTDE